MRTGRATNVGVYGKIGPKGSPTHDLREIILRQRIFIQEREVRHATLNALFQALGIRRIFVERRLASKIESLPEIECGIDPAARLREKKDFARQALERMIKRSQFHDPEKEESSLRIGLFIEDGEAYIYAPDNLGTPAHEMFYFQKL